MKAYTIGCKSFEIRVFGTAKRVYWYRLPGRPIHTFSIRALPYVGAGVFWLAFMWLAGALLTGLAH